jgi:hypothetical protein
MVTHVDLAAAMCKALDLPDHSAVQPHLDRTDPGAGWITREGAIRLAERLLLDAGAVPEEVLAKTRQEAYRRGYEDGWRDCLGVWEQKIRFEGRKGVA